MTSNHPEKLDPALIRPGRIDKIIEFKNANREQAIAIGTNFFPEASAAVLEEFADFVVAEKLSMCKVQELLLTVTDLTEAYPKPTNRDNHEELHTIN